LSNNLFIRVFALVFILMGAKFANAQPTEAQFCKDGRFVLMNKEVEGGMLDLALDLEDYVGEEILILSHMVMNYRDRKDQRVASVSDISDCYYDIDRYNVDEPTAYLESREEVLVVLWPSDFDKDVYREIRRMLATKTSKVNSHNHFVIIGTVKLSVDTFEPYVHVRELKLYDYP